MKNKLTNRKARKIKNLLAVWVLLLPAVICMYLMVWRPSAMGIVWSFFDMKGFTPTDFCGLKNYIRVIKNTEFLPIVWNTVQYVFWSFVIGFLPPLFIAFMLNEIIHFRSIMRVLIYLPAILPGTTVLLLWYMIYSPDSSGMLNTLLAQLGLDPYGWLNDPNFVIIYIIIEMTWAGFPGTMFLYFTTIQGISPDLYEAAAIDGAGPIKLFIHVSLPQISGLLLLNIVRQMIGVFQTMQEPMVMTGGGPNNASTTVGYQIYQYAFVQGRVGQALALGTLTFVVLMIATCFYFKLNKKVEDNF